MNYSIQTLRKRCKLLRAQVIRLKKANRELIITNRHLQREIDRLKRIDFSLDWPGCWKNNPEILRNNDGTLARTN